MFNGNYTNYGTFDNKRFLDVFPDAEKFLEEYNSRLSAEYDIIRLTDEQLTLIYYILYGKYGSEYIAASTESRFKVHLFNIINLNGSILLKELETQNAILQLSDEEIRSGSKAIYNHAFNPSTDPSTATLEELPYINDQNTTKYLKSPLEGYNMLLNLLDSDVIERFLRRFKKLFLRVLAPNRAQIYDVEQLIINLQGDDE